MEIRTIYECSKCMNSIPKEIEDGKYEYNCTLSKKKQSDCKRNIEIHFTDAE